MVLNLGSTLEYPEWPMKIPIPHDHPGITSSEFNEVGPQMTPMYSQS